MINSDKLTEAQRSGIIQNFITILASHEGFMLEEELEQKPDDPNVMRLKNTAQSLLDAVIEAI